MAVLNKIPTTGPINLVDIRDTINANGGSANNDLTSFFQTDDIDKWAHKKPVPYSVNFGLTDQMRYLADQGLDNSIISTSNVAKTLLDKAAAGTDFYPYVPVAGGSGSPMRLGDFLGYNPKAVAPYYFTAPEHYEVQSFPATLYCWISLNSGAEFTIEDMASFDNFGNDKHIGILWTAGDGTYYLYNPQGGDINNGIELAFSINETGTYHLLAVYTDYSAGYGNIDVTGEADLFVPVPDGYRKVVVERLEVYGEIALSGFLDGSSLYFDSTSSVYGFSSYPRFSLTFPNGTTPSCTYRLGLFFKVIADNGTFYNTWWYNDEYITHSGGQTSRDVQFVNFPTSISLSDVFGSWDSGANISSIEIKLQLERVEGQGYLSFGDSVTETYNVVV